MHITHQVPFNIDLTLNPENAIEFVRNVKMSLRYADFIEDLHLMHEQTLGHDFVRAKLPINAAMFGQQELTFQSLLIPTVDGARLQALPFDTPKTGWAEVAGQAVVNQTPFGSRVRYDFEITIHLTLPKAEKWGGRALVRMIEFTAQQVLENIAARFPEAVKTAALAFEQDVNTPSRIIYPSGQHKP